MGLEVENAVKLADPGAKVKLLRRVRRIEGQARGVARMIEEDRDCGEILQQLAAVRSAAHQATVWVTTLLASTMTSLMPWRWLCPDWPEGLSRHGPIVGRRSTVRLTVDTLLD